MEPSGGAIRCQVCGEARQADDVLPAQLVRGSIVAVIRREHPDWTAEGYICLPCLNRFRIAYVRDVLETEKGELSALEEEVMRSLRERELLSRDVNAEFDRRLTLGERVADKVAEFGGSWAFIFSFVVVLALWIAVNAVPLLRRPFDPYPFILLNLVLSCLAAIQAPIIMMSQNRQEARDRLRAENDYRVNLKAELEVRLLHSKIDQLLTHQWQRLLEIQQMQMELMAELLRRSPGDRGG